MDYANPAALVSTDWVASHLHDTNVRLLEVDVDTTAYDRGQWRVARGARRYVPGDRAVCTPRALV